MESSEEESAYLIGLLAAGFSGFLVGLTVGAALIAWLVP